MVTGRSQVGTPGTATSNAPARLPPLAAFHGVALRDALEDLAAPNVAGAPGGRELAGSTEDGADLLGEGAAAGIRLIALGVDGVEAIARARAAVSAHPDALSDGLAVLLVRVEDVTVVEADTFAAGQLGPVAAVLSLTRLLRPHRRAGLRGPLAGLGRIRGAGEGEQQKDGEEGGLHAPHRSTRRRSLSGPGRTRGAPPVRVVARSFDAARSCGPHWTDARALVADRLAGGRRLR